MSRLEQLLDSIEDLNKQIRDLTVMRNEEFKNAKGEGFDTKIMRKVLKVRKNRKEYENELSLVDIYLAQIKE